LSNNLSIEGVPSSLVLTNFEDLAEPCLFLGIGTTDGVCYGFRIKGSEAEDLWVKTVGSEEVNLSEVEVFGTKGIVVSSTTMLFVYSYLSRMEFTPISYQPIRAVASFVTDFAGDSLAGITDESMVVISFESLEDKFTTMDQPLLFTPRKVIKTMEFPTTVICGDNRCKVYTPLLNGENNDFEERKIGVNLEEDGVWGSEVGIIEHTGYNSSIKTEGAIVCGAHVFFKTTKRCFVCSLVHDYKENTGECWIVVYNAINFNQIHKTPVESVCRALCAFEGKLLAGIGTTLRMYDLGKQILIRRCEVGGIPSDINGINVSNNKIVLSTVASGFVYVDYDVEANILKVVDQDKVWHSLTSSTILDEQTTIGFDKYGSLFITEIDWELGNDEVGFLDRVKEVVQWYVGDVVTSVSVNEIWKGNLPEDEPTTAEEVLRQNKKVIVYSCLMGRIGVLVPLNFKNEAEFFVNLETSIKKNFNPLLSNSFDMYRGSCYPSFGVIDGDLCDFYNQMDGNLQQQIADVIGLTPVDVKVKCDDFKHSKLC
ncbi:CPSF A subunit region protein, putative, partial [Entamoeba invadens IP1]|uniref:CPSF A subunit region protein, putative n=1 Tax=Entamoeba invadens IP1 TaxID=370355 RepID=UPI0002C3D978